MGVPKQALEAAEAADKAMEAMTNNQSNRPPVTAVEPNLDAQATPNAEQPVAVPQQAAVEQQVAPSGVDELADLRAERDREQMLRKTLEGRLKSQLKPAHEEIRQLRKELAEQTSKVNMIIEESKKPGAQRFLSEDEAAELGDVIDVNERMVKGVIEESLESGSIAKMVEQLVEQSKSAQAEAASGPSDDFWPLVDQYQPGAREINRSGDPAWIEFLDEYDHRSGIQNRVLAEQAIGNDDPLALADIFADFFKRHNGIVDPATAAPVAARRVMPEGAPNGAPVLRQPAANEVESFTKQEVELFYSDLVRGKFKGTQADAERIENQIMAAAQAGRLT